MFFLYGKNVLFTPELVTLLMQNDFGPKLLLSCFEKMIKFSLCISAMRENLMEILA